MLHRRKKSGEVGQLITKCSAGWEPITRNDFIVCQKWEVQAGWVAASVVWKEGGLRGRFVRGRAVET